ncbi:3-methyl-2-oxobutanoate hydroxymethyltransferase [Enterococcus sp. 669A]|uniref:3-methyl-2-oxobutanoate hydroxymethyltransferase n=1 Tax=Candidatus Enterococcus moelleringii TaxID=2815325 RepID=A0ABS3LEK5_9ENTE|nr:3-methyl-2-oxobutanoate hydroxymethyltransferase [Enterococcus sp. 669A]MBO1308065.1 3-methyl-2-oxobutanoate hydroxymethyltransferase [Enterococcus sp. 669A]
MKNTTASLQKQKQQQEKISMLTAYDYTTARLVDKAGINAILVGDSLGMVMLGYENTLAVTMEDMIHHSKAVARGAKNALVVTDLPFLSYHTSIEEAVLNAGRLLKEGDAQAVKLEGGVEFAEVIQAITRASIPVMGHVGLTPQSVHSFGGFKIQGKTEAAARKVVQDALAVEAAGAFAIVLEGVPEKLGQLITELLTIPTIGIGAGRYTDGQVLVYQDMLAMYDGFQPKFVKQYAAIGEDMVAAFANYHQEVGSQAFPADEHVFAIQSEVMDTLRQEFGEAK